MTYRNRGNNYPCWPTPDEVKRRQALYADDPLWVVTDTGNRRRRNKPGVKLKQEIRAEVFQRDDFTCQLCGFVFPSVSDYDGAAAPWVRDRGSLELDHIVPYSKGGQFTVDNLRAACRQCNMRRGNRQEV